MSRLLVITELFLPTKGGTAVWFDEVYRRLGGKNIVVITKSVEGDVDYDANHPNTIVRLSLRRHAWLKPESLVMYAKFLVSAVAQTSKGEICAIHAGRVLPEGLIGLVVAKLTGKPLLVYAHGEEITGWRAPWKYRAMRFVYRHADQIVANSKFTRDKLIELGANKKNIVLLSPGVNVARFHTDYRTDDLRAAMALKPNQYLILSVGRLQRRKGFDNVIRALPALNKKGLDAKYALIGIGEDRQYLESIVLECGVQDRVSFLGHVPMDDLPRWYNACDVFVMPNREIDGDIEGFGMVFLEAAACGKPAIAGFTGGTADAVVNNETGLLVDGESVDAIAEALSVILGDPITARSMGQAGYRRAVADFSWEAIARRTRLLSLGIKDI